jgi:hypothetical protein
MLIVSKGLILMSPFLFIFDSTSAKILLIKHRQQNSTQSSAALEQRNYFIFPKLCENKAASSERAKKN